MDVTKIKADDFAKLLQRIFEKKTTQEDVWMVMRMKSQIDRLMGELSHYRADKSLQNNWDLTKENKT